LSPAERGGGESAEAVQRFKSLRHCPPIAKPNNYQHINNKHPTFSSTPSREMSFLNFFKQRMGFQPISNTIARDRLAMMVKQQRMCVHNEKLLFDVTTVVTQYLKIQADKNPYISCVLFTLA
jgi:hypothetical protein